jgi:hypothetical protein
MRTGYEPLAESNGAQRLCRQFAAAHLLATGFVHEA